MRKKIYSILALLCLTVIVGEVQAQKSLPSKHGFEQNRKSANAREAFGQNRKSANAREVQSATTAQTPSRRSVLRAPSTDVQAPTDVTASDITGASATVSWNGTGDSYNLRYRKMYLSEGFESCSHGELPAGWTALDADGDGHSWFAYDYSEQPDDDPNPDSFDNMSVESASYDYDKGALTPDNWLISPQVPLKGKLSLWAKGVDPEYAAEHFAIYLSTTGNDVADFTVLIPETVAKDVFTEYTADLSAYAGQVGYIAIRHFHVTDVFVLAVDNITITDDWVEVDGVTSPYTLDGLEELSSYEVEVQAVTGEQQSSWSTLRFNTSGLPPTPAAYTVTLKEGTEDATSWTITPDEATTTGVAAGTEVTATYSGAKKVKSVKAKKKAAAGPTYNETKSINDGPVTVAAGEHWLITGTGTQTSNAMSIGAGATVTLDGVNISSSGYCIKCAGDATIILKDGSTNTLTSTGDALLPALSIGDANTTLTIQGSTGVLNVESGDYCAGIGGGYSNTNSTCGNIRIEGGVITVQGGYGGAGIGTDVGEATCGDIIITGGTITANGGGRAAGIGGGTSDYGNTVCGNITIANTVTKVTAKAGNQAPYSIGKGYGSNASCGTVTIGGTVYPNGISDSPFTYEP